KSRLEHVVAYWALQKLGGVAVPVNFRLAANELRYLLDDSGAKIALYEDSTAATMLEATDGMSIRCVFVGDTAPAGTPAFAELERSTAGAPALEPPGEDDLSLIVYTSGTTGRPKGVPRTHKNHYAGDMAHVIQCGYEWGERTLGVMPLYHTMGVHALTSMAAINGCFVCPPDWSSEIALRLIATERLTALYLIPTLFWELVHAPGLVRTDVASVRKLAYAGAPMLAPLTEMCAKTFQPDAFVKQHRSTRPLRTTRVRAGGAAIHAALGRVAASAERRVGPDETVPAGERGEIIASLTSDEAFSGYWNRPDADARAMREGWYFTGDMGWLDADGDLWVAGRVDDMIISGGENIHPVEIEDVLARHDGVKDVAVIGEPDEKWGERVVAFVVAAPGLTAGPPGPHRRARGELATFKRPRRFVFVAAIPKTASGKILRRLLRDGRYTEVRP